ncbi:MAG: hypothetical protein V4671_04780 [Armatimonadota bacterium]
MSAIQGAAVRGLPIRCPHCDKPIPGIQIIGGTTAVTYNRDTITFDRGTVPCRCGARLVILLGVVAESVAPRMNQIEMERDA